MNRWLQRINFLGVLLVATLCVAQWQINRRLNLEINSLEKTRLEQQEKLSKQTKTVSGLTEDLAQIKEQFSLAHSNLAELRGKLRHAESENDSLQNERAKFRESLTNWTRAVAERDAQLAKAHERMNSMSAQLDESIGKYNQLATNYNAVVKQLEEARAQK